MVEKKRDLGKIGEKLYAMHEDMKTVDFIPMEEKNKQVQAEKHNEETKYPSIDKNDQDERP